MNAIEVDAREKAQAALSALLEAVRQYLGQHPSGVPTKQAREDLGLDSDDDGEFKGYLFWGIQHILGDEIAINRDARPHRICLKNPNARP
jgi:hypothetical protein